MATRNLVAYADGSCLGNPGPGGWGVVLLEGADAPREFSGAERTTTNNRMEITAAIKALQAVPAEVRITIRSDSQYLVKTMTLGWKRRENLDLWQVLDREAARRKVSWQWVRGHCGDRFNERADMLARSAALGKPTESSPADYTPRAVSAVANQTAPPLPLSVAGELGDPEESELVRALRPLLHEGETLRRCAGCGQAFVAAGVPPPGSAYCSLARCQVLSRSAPN